MGGAGRPRGARPYAWRSQDWVSHLGVGQGRPSGCFETRPVSGEVLQLRCAITAEPRKLIRGFLTWQSKPGGRWRGRALSPLPLLQHPER